jgi:hypothetical protein
VVQKTGNQMNFLLTTSSLRGPSSPAGIYKHNISWETFCRNSWTKACIPGPVVLEEAIWQTVPLGQCEKQKAGLTSLCLPDLLKHHPAQKVHVNTLVQERLSAEWDLSNLTPGAAPFQSTDLSQNATSTLYQQP